jgi:hypothetical protein
VNAVRLLFFLVAAVAVAVSAASASGTAMSSSGAFWETRSPSPRTSRVFRLPAGKGQRRFTMQEPAGVMRLTRITVPDGVHAYVEALIGSVGGSRFSTGYGRPDPALVCHRRGVDEVCTQQQEWCPMPAGRWRLRLVKTAGPAGPVRVDFVVGPPPAKT